MSLVDAVTSYPGGPHNNGARRNVAQHRPSWDADQVAITPESILEPVRQAFGGFPFGLDPCTESDNPVGAERFYALPVDGLSMPWADRPWGVGPIWCNPPWGRALRQWVDKAIDAGSRGRGVALLIPASTATRHGASVLESADATVFVTGYPTFRLRDGRESRTVHYGVMLALWNPMIVHHLRALGPVLRRA